MGQSAIKNVASARWTAAIKHPPPPPPPPDVSSAGAAPMAYIEKWLVSMLISWLSGSTLWISTVTQDKMEVS